ncbi:hypothetical protein Y032_0220g2523 [Ancylostoma ceylanicum]|uniref:Helix-turn-helix domain-containing protein n=1 Tax=Ancylostoma ceylanicum TaxID=53326 RepID=A0A016SJF1_9BILA|nr:hypothetical protein Y032_0220g2523 [Ancylostoma ceylanicum]
MDECFGILNQQSEHISFTRETPKDGWLAFLNTQVNLFNNTIRVKWYRKASSKNILIHATSAHPLSVKRAIVRNMFRTASQVCSDDHQREESLRLASSIARENGYSLCRRRAPHSGYFHGLKGKKNLSLYLPFISDDTSTEIRRCLARVQLQNDVTLVNVPTRNSWFGIDCMTANSACRTSLSSALTGRQETLKNWSNISDKVFEL